MSFVLPGIPSLDLGPSSAERVLRLSRSLGSRANEVTELCRLAADPDLALSGVERFLDAAGSLPEERDLLEALCLLCGSSRLIASLLAREPRLLRRVARSHYLYRPRPRGELGRILERASRPLSPDDVAGLNRLLRRVRAREIVRIALRDLLRAKVIEVTGELSALAFACLEAAIRFHDKRLRARHGPPEGEEKAPPGAGFCVMAMGKLGALELNFSSDVDLVFVYGKDGHTSGVAAGPGEEPEHALTHFAYYAKLAELVTESIARPTEDGYVFRVDLDLRPDGRNGPIVNSVRAAELYYESFGRSWERNALVKARPAAGDLAVGEALLKELSPFIWRRTLDLAVVAEIHAMKLRINTRAGAERQEDLKLGRGGIREIEFFVSALQLLHGGSEDGRVLRERSVIPALDRLLFFGVVPAKDRDKLADAWLFLRRAEHRLQMVDGAQTHTLPPREERLPLARAMGYPSIASFEQDLFAHRERVADLFSNLMGRSVDEPRLDKELSLLIDPEVEPARRLAIASRKGLSDPERAIAAIDTLARRRTPFAPHGDLVQAVSLLDDALGTPDPDQALRHLADFAAALRNPAPYFEVLRERRQMARLLLSLFGTSDFLSKRFLRYPELVEALLRGSAQAQAKDRAAFERELLERRRAQKLTGHLDLDVEEELSELRRYRNEEILRIGLSDIAGLIDLGSVAAQLTSLAEACLERCLDLAEHEAEARGQPVPPGLCVVGMGKLGGNELGYHSDLDLIFLYPSGPPERHPLYARLAQRFLAFLQMPLREGRLYQIDTRLRPSGNQGVLVVGVDGFTRYHLGEEHPSPTGAAVPVRSQLWERQALLRARYVAGDREPFEGVMERVILPVVYGQPSSRAELAAEIRRMRERMESEIGREASRGKNPKTGHGGLVDVEFAAQFLQLLHGHDHPFLRTPSTPVALERLWTAGLLLDETYRDLARGYEFLRRVELRLRIVHDYAIDHLPESGAQLDQLARRLSYAGPEPGLRFLTEYARITSAVRSAFDRVVC